MNILISTLFILSLSFNLYSMESQLPPLSSSPSSKGIFTVLNRFVANTTDNLFGHGDGYIDELGSKQESFRAFDMNLSDLLQLTHRGEWGMLEFLKASNKEKVKQCLELTDKHAVPLNPAIINAAKKLLEIESAGPIFIRQFKDKKINPDTIEANEDVLHLAENAIKQYIQSSNPELLNEVLQLVQKHSIRINPIISLKALQFLNTHQIECQRKILALIANIHQTQTFKASIDDKVQLSESTVLFNTEEFKEQLKQAVNPK